MTNASWSTCLPGTPVSAIRILQPSRASPRCRFVVRRSPIAQLGVFTAAHVPGGALLMEYYGEAVRPTVADVREKRCVGGRPRRRWRGGAGRGVAWRGVAWRGVAMA